MKLLLVLGLILSFPSWGAGELWSSDIAAAKKAAKKAGKPMIIDFFGIWCPPCNELDETVFNTPAFLEKAKSFQLLKVDADATTSWDIKNQYKVGGYPTVVFTDPKGEEIYRIVGYRPANEFNRILDLVKAAKAKPLAKACKSKEAEDLWRCALVCGERKDQKCAEKAYQSLEKTLKPGTPRYLMARTYFADNAANDDLKRQGYLALMKEYPASPMALIWANSYYESLGKDQPAAKSELVDAVLDNYPKMMASPDLSELGLPETDLAQMRADLLGDNGRKEESKKAWKEAADLFEKKLKDWPEGTSLRGFTLERISCLEMAGDESKALALAQEYRSKYPTEFTFHFIAASILDRTKKYSDALPIAQKAYDVSYGDNKIRAATLLINLLATVPQKEAINKVFSEVTSSIKPDQKLEVRTHRYLKRLDEAYKRATI